VAAGFFGLVPLLAPGVFTAVHLHLTAPFLIRLAGASSLGYAVVAVLAQRALSRLEMRLTLVGTAIFNGVGGLVSLPYLRAGDVLVLPWVIAPVGLLVCAGCVYLLWQMFAA